MINITLITYVVTNDQRDMEPVTVHQEFPQSYRRIYKIDQGGRGPSPFRIGTPLHNRYRIHQYQLQLKGKAGGGGVFLQKEKRFLDKPEDHFPSGHGTFDC